MLRFMVFGCALAVWAFHTAPVEAQAISACGDHATIVSSLDKKYSEAPVSLGLAADGSMIEIYASQEGTFTILATKPTGVSCIIATGNSFESFPGRKADLKI